MNGETIKVGTACLEQAFTSPEELAADAREMLYGVEFDTMAGTGFSGALVVPALARAMGKNFVLTRKPGDSHHHGNAVAEGSFGSDWIFVDDGIETGATIRRVLATMRELGREHGIRTEFKGAYLYGHGFWSAFLSPAEVEEVLGR
jgi:adenine/guanine phosphoribosyltransferase-like PRPP-binding protein